MQPRCEKQEKGINYVWNYPTRTNELLGVKGDRGRVLVEIARIDALEIADLATNRKPFFALRRLQGSAVALKVHQRTPKKPLVLRRPTGRGEAWRKERMENDAQVSRKLKKPRVFHTIEDLVERGAAIDFGPAFTQ